MTCQTALSTSRPLASGAALLCLTGLLAAPHPAAAEPPSDIGSTVAVVNLVTAALAQETRTLAVGDGVRENEIIEVATNGSSEIKLEDQTKLALGPGARLVLDKFVYDRKRTDNAILVNLAKGAFRFVTGVAAKPAYVVRVPGASITVRGTIFDVFVEQSGASWLLLHEGGVRVCADNGSCRNHDQPGNLVRITEGSVGSPKSWRASPGVEKISFDTAFPFVSKTPSIDPEPVFSRDEIVGPGTRAEGPPSDDPPTGKDETGGAGPGSKTGSPGPAHTEPERRAHSGSGKKIAAGAALALAPVVLGHIRDRVHDRDYDDDDDIAEHLAERAKKRTRVLAERSEELGDAMKSRLGRGLLGRIGRGKVGKYPMPR